MKDTFNMNEETNIDESTVTTMKEVVYLSTGELNEQLESLLATATIADKKWLWNYFQGHDRWPVITDEVDLVPNYGIPRLD